jgi:hypothetical protein
VFKNKQTELNYQPIPRGIYAWTQLRAGDFIVYVESLKECHKFITLPGPCELFLTFEDFTKSVKAGALELVEQLPNEIYQETILLSCPPKDSKIIIDEN